jgi:hypothetical protein
MVVVGLIDFSNLDGGCKSRSQSEDQTWKFCTGLVNRHLVVNRQRIAVHVFASQSRRYLIC